MRVRAHPIERDARAHGAARHFGVPENARGIGHAGGRPFLRETSHAGDLTAHRRGTVGEIRRLGVRKVRHHPFDAHARNRRELIVHDAHFRRKEAQAVHAGIHLDVHAHVAKRTALQNVDLPERMHDRLDAELLQGLDVVRVKKAFQKKNALLPAVLPCTARVREVDRREPVRVGEGLHRVLKTVPVCIGLDDGPEHAVSRGSAHARKIVTKGGQINFGVNRTRHETPLEKRMDENVHYRSLEIPTNSLGYAFAPFHLAPKKGKPSGGGFPGTQSNSKE